MSRDDARAALLALLDWLSEPATVVVTSTGIHATVQLPGPSAEARPNTPCEDDILYVLGEVRHRLTTPALLAEMEQRNLIHGETTIKLALASLVKAGRINNRS